MNTSEMKSHEIKPRKPAVKTNILEVLLCEGEQHYAKVIELLKVFPENIEEYQALLEKEIHLKNIINQLKGQLQVREEMRSYERP